MRTIYHEFESLDHLLATRMLPGGGSQPIRLVVFGGTGAVGGAAILELCKLCLLSKRYRNVPLRAEIYATGSTDKEISKFAGRLYLAMEGRAEITKVDPLKHYRIGDQIAFGPYEGRTLDAIDYARRRVILSDGSSLKMGASPPTEAPPTDTPQAPQPSQPDPLAGAP